MFVLGDMPALGQFQTFPNDHAGFVAAAGPLSVIDFETLPNGQPHVTMPGARITETFNYDALGAHFSAPIPYPFIAGNEIGGFSLRADTFPTFQRTWIIADMVSPARSVGAFFPGGTEMCAFDVEGSQIGCVAYGGSGDFFVGLVSDEPILRVVFDSGASHESISSFMFSPVPEPCTGVLLGSGLVWIVLRRRRSRTGSEDGG